MRKINGKGPLGFIVEKQRGGEGARLKEGGSRTMQRLNDELWLWGGSREKGACSEDGAGALLLVQTDAARHQKNRP